MKCPKCQAENREDAEFCGDCGITLEVACPKCGRSNPTSKKFCDKCGHSLGESKAALPVDYTQPQTYTPKFLADKILTARSSIEGERKLVTVLFTDVAGYTSMSEKLDPEEVHQIMDGCFKLLMDEIHRYEGTIDKFTGDGVMALFGAPLAHEDHAQRAGYAALAIQKAIGEYGKKMEKECGVEFKMRVGINSGLVIVGSVGNDLRMDYTAIGDTVNLASRMESMAKAGIILVSSDTHRMAKDFFKFKPLGKLAVKGKEEPLEAYQLIEAGEVETRIEAAVARGLTRFVGRKREIEALQEAFEKAQSGSGQVIGIVGEAGVGKSRIIIELREMIPKEEYTYLQGRCLHYGGSMAYLPFLDILRAYFDIKEGDREFIIKKKMKEKVRQLDGKLKGILPPLHDILSLKVEDEQYLNLAPAQKRDKTFEAIRDLLIRESQNRPLIIAVEDLHWIDRTSEEFLSYLIGWLANAHILLILLYRPEYTHQWGSKSYYSQLSVDQLSTGTSAELVQSILEGGEVVPELRELILSRTAGNPLFVEELTHTLLENGSIQKKDHQYVLTTKSSDIQVPDTIQGIIAARMDRLEDNLKRTMQVASVVGRDFAFRVLDTITGMREELKSYLLNLQGLEFIYEKSLFPELEYIFKHALTQEVAYNSLLLKRRKEIHENIGQAIEELYSDRLEEFYEMLAHHYSRSENLEKAYHYLKLSGNKAVRNFSNWEGFQYYKEAINLLNQLPDTEENKRRGVEIRISMDFPLLALAYPEDSLQIALDGERLARELGDEKGLAHILGMIGCCSFFRGDPREGLKYAEESFKLAEETQDIGVMASTLFDLGQSYQAAGEYTKMIDVLPRVIALLEETHKESESFGRGFNIYSQLVGQYGLATGTLGDLAEGEALLEKALHFAKDIGDLYSLAWIEFNYGQIFMMKGDGINCVEHIKNAIKYGEEADINFMLGYLWSSLGMGHYFLGELDIALQYMEKGLKMQSDMGFPTGLSQHYYNQAMVYCDIGDLKKAQDCVEEALKLSQEYNEKFCEGMSTALQGRVLGKADPSQSSRAEELILQGIYILEELKVKPMVSLNYLLLAELYGNMGQSEKAQKIYREMGLA